MATVNIELRSYKNKKGEQSLELKIRSGSKTVTKATGISIPAKDWDAAKQLVKRSHPLFSEYNDVLRARVPRCSGRCQRACSPASR